MKSVWLTRQTLFPVTVVAPAVALCPDHKARRDSDWLSVNWSSFCLSHASSGWTSTAPRASMSLLVVLKYRIKTSGETCYGFMLWVGGGIFKHQLGFWLIHHLLLLPFDSSCIICISPHSLLVVLPTVTLSVHSISDLISIDAGLYWTVFIIIAFKSMSHRQDSFHSTAITLITAFNSTIAMLSSYHVHSISPFWSCMLFWMTLSVRCNYLTVPTCYKNEVVTSLPPLLVDYCFPSPQTVEFYSLEWTDHLKSDACDETSLLSLLFWLEPPRTSELFSPLWLVSPAPQSWGQTLSEQGLM